jgi:hypothetical protein
MAIEDTAHVHAAAAAPANAKSTLAELSISA